MQKLGLFLLFAFLLGSITLAGAELARQAYFYPAIPTPDYPSPQDRVAAWEQDLHYFQTYIQLNRPYTDTSRAAAMSIVQDLTKNIEHLTDAELKLDIARAIALSQNGHSFLRLSDLTLSEGRIPIMGRMFDDGYYFLWAASEYQQLTGARLVTIDGHPIEDIISAFRPYSGARDSYFRLYVGWLLETPSLVHAVGFANNPDFYTLGIQLSGRDDLVEVNVAPDNSIATPIINAHDVLTPQQIEQWQGLPHQIENPPYTLQDWQQPFNYREIEAINGFYIRYGANHDLGDYLIQDFNQTIRDELSTHAYSVVIVDQRFNNGGDYLLTHRIMTEIPRLVDDSTSIYVITGSMTFSAGISSVAFLKSSGGEQVSIIGTEIGDFERMWGETSLMTLPNSGLRLQLATGLHDYHAGCYEFPQCYWLDFFFNVSVGSLNPDIVIPFTFDDYYNGRDAVIDYIVNAHL
jgi:hypothetical protein